MDVTGSVREKCDGGRRWASGGESRAAFPGSSSAASVSGAGSPAESGHPRRRRGRSRGDLTGAISRSGPGLTANDGDNDRRKGEVFGGDLVGGGGGVMAMETVVIHGGMRGAKAALPGRLRQR